MHSLKGTSHVSQRQEHHLIYEPPFRGFPTNPGTGPHSLVEHWRFTRKDFEGNLEHARVRFGVFAGTEEEIFLKCVNELVRVAETHPLAFNDITREEMIPEAVRFVKGEIE